MRKRLLSMGFSFSLLLSLLLVGNVAVASAHTNNGGSGRYDHIFYIMMENHSTNEIIGNTKNAPYINLLAQKYGVALNYYGVTHPSLPNYLAAIAGDYQGIWDDCKAGATVTCAPEEFGPNSGYTNGKELLTPAEIASATKQAHWFNGQTIVDQLEQNNLTWKAYMQSIPSVGATDEYYPVVTVNGKATPLKLYAQKHNPFEYFSNIRNNPERMQKIVPFTQFGLDLANNTVPNFVWISPDQCNDMHGVSKTNAAILGIPACANDPGAIQLGDDFIQATVAEIRASKAWTQKSAIVIVWDENDYTGFTGCCHSPTGVGGVTLGGARAPFMVITSKHARHIVDSSTPYNHYSLLATIEKLWGLGYLANANGFSKDQLLTKFF